MEGAFLILYISPVQLVFLAACNFARVLLSFMTVNIASVLSQFYFTIPVMICTGWAKKPSDVY